MLSWHVFTIEQRTFHFIQTLVGLVSLSFWVVACHGHKGASHKKRQGKVDNEGKLKFPNKINNELIDENERE